MNGLSFSELCCLFCCPPCPSRIAAKLAFLPPEPTYSFISDETASRYSLHLTEKAEWQYTQRELDVIEVFMTRTSRGNRIACMFVRCCPNARYTILFSHGNAVDLGQMSSFYIGLGSRINCNIFSFDYSGYGTSSGRASEKNLYSDIDAAWQALRTRYGISPQNVILYGQSIGTVPTVDLASRFEVGAVILHSPLMSGMRVAFPETKRTWFFDAFPRYVYPVPIYVYFFNVYMSVSFWNLFISFMLENLPVSCAWLWDFTRICSVSSLHTACHYQRSQELRHSMVKDWY